MTVVLPPMPKPVDYELLPRGYLTHDEQNNYERALEIWQETVFKIAKEAKEAKESEPEKQVEG